jgi:nitroreductase
MDAMDAIRGRRSIRKFKPDEVPRDVLTEILEAGRWSPSWGNTQPWEVYVITGNTLERFRQESLQAARSGAVSSVDVPMPQAWPDQLKKRYGEMGEVVLDSLEIKRDDKEARNRQTEFMITLFGAPCLLVFCVPAEHSSIPYALLDIGLITQTVCLAAHVRGVGSCIMAMAVIHPEILRKLAGIPQSKRIVVGLAMGYPETGFPLNNFERKRAELDSFVRWVE